MPIDVPFTELNRVMELQLKGKTFPETGNAPGQVTCWRRASRRRATGC